MKQQDLVFAVCGRSEMERVREATAVIADHAVKLKIAETYTKFKDFARKEPFIAECVVRFNEDGAVETRMIALKSERVMLNKGYFDGDIFFYVDDVVELIYLANHENGEKFVVIDVKKFA